MWDLKIFPYHLFFLEWTPVIPNSCIAGRHIKSYKDVAKVDDCKVLCEKDPACKSIDYHPTTKACNFNDADTSSVQILTPCSGYQFVEPIRGMVLC